MTPAPPQPHRFRLKGDPAPFVGWRGKFPPDQPPPGAEYWEPTGDPLPVPDHVPGAGNMIPPSGAAVRPAPAPIPLPCVHEGHTQPPPRGREYEGRTWLGCDAGKGGGTVCRCECGPGCDRYEPDAGV